MHWLQYMAVILDHNAVYQQLITQDKVNNSKWNNLKLKCSIKIIFSVTCFVFLKEDKLPAFESSGGSAVFNTRGSMEWDYMKIKHLEVKTE